MITISSLPVPPEPTGKNSFSRLGQTLSRTRAKVSGRETRIKRATPLLTSSTSRLLKEERALPLPKCSCATTKVVRTSARARRKPVGETPGTGRTSAVVAIKEDPTIVSTARARIGNSQAALEDQATHRNRPPLMAAVRRALEGISHLGEAQAQTTDQTTTTSAGATIEDTAVNRTIHAATKGAAAWSAATLVVSTATTPAPTSVAKSRWETMRACRTREELGPATIVTTTIGREAIEAQWVAPTGVPDERIRAAREARTTFRSRIPMTAAITAAEVIRGNTGRHRQIAGVEGE